MSRQRICTRCPAVPLMPPAPAAVTPSASRSSAALAHQAERVVAAVGREAAADQHPHVACRSRPRPGPPPRTASPSRRRGPCRPRAVSRIAADSQPVALTTTTVRSAGGAPASRSAATAASGSRRSAATATSQRPTLRRPRSSSAPSTSTATTVPPRRAVARGRHRELAGVAGAEDEDVVARAEASARTCDAAAQTSSTSMAIASGRSSGGVVHDDALGEVGGAARPRPAPMAGSSGRRARAAAGSVVSEESETIGSPTPGGSGRASPTAADPPVEHAAGVGVGVVQLAAVGDDRGDAMPPSDPGRVPAPSRDRAERGRVKAEELDVDLDLGRPDRPRGIEPRRGLRQRTAWFDHAVGAQPLLQAGLHERPLG